jgi:hypothetical protein
MPEETINDVRIDWLINEDRIYNGKEGSLRTEDKIKNGIADNKKIYRTIPVLARSDKKKSKAKKTGLLLTTNRELSS